MKVIFFDTETSGLDCRSCKIIELAMFTVVDGEVVEKYDEFVNIGEPVSPKITDITGITNSMLREDGIDEETVAWDLKRRLTPGTVMVAHNCQFDLQFVYNLLYRQFQDEAFAIRVVLENVEMVDASLVHVIEVRLASLSGLACHGVISLR